MTPLQHLLHQVAQGQVPPDQAYQTLQTLQGFEDLSFAKLDHQRPLRTGFPEVVWGPGKTPEQIAQIMRHLVASTPVVMATRITAEVFSQIQQQLPGVEYSPTARICSFKSAPPPPQVGTITLLTAGTADLPVAEEAALTAELSGFQVQRLWDVGVAGIHRLLHHQDLIARAQVLIVVAGMEGALPSVVAGLAACPVIAVPTSIGYGANFQGLSALLGMLNSCATGVGVVNIDNGFGAAMLAGQILRTARHLATAGAFNGEAWGG
jgi:pyridinium-3,5-biscarboxylic acid mononucleotide synthase